MAPTIKRTSLFFRGMSAADRRMRPVAVAGRTAVFGACRPLLRTRNIGFPNLRHQTGLTQSVDHHSGILPERFAVVLMALVAASWLVAAVSACTRVEEIDRTVEVEKRIEVPVTVEVERQVLVDKVVTVEVEKRIEVPVTVEVERQVLIDKVVTVEIENWFRRRSWSRRPS